MLTFIQFLNEQENPTQLKDFLESNCQEFLSQSDVMNNGNFLVRSVNNTPSNYSKVNLEANDLQLKAGILTVRKDRKPLSFSEEMQKALDDYFDSRFNVRPRSNGLFCQSSVNNSDPPATYGLRSFIVFPIGEFKVIWSSKVRDLFATGADFVYAEDGEKALHRYLDDKHYQVGRLKSAMENTNELMIVVDKVLMVEYDRSDTGYEVGVTKKQITDYLKNA